MFRWKRSPPLTPQHVSINKPRNLPRFDDKVMVRTPNILAWHQMSTRNGGQHRTTQLSQFVWHGIESNFCVFPSLKKKRAVHTKSVNFAQQCSNIGSVLVHQCCRTRKCYPVCWCRNKSQVFMVAVVCMCFVSARPCATTYIFCPSPQCICSFFDCECVQDWLTIPELLGSKFSTGCFFSQVF